MARRDNPHARCTTEIPPKPKLTASLAAIMRRVRSSKSGHTERNFCINSDRVLMLRKHTTITHKLIPLFIYTALVSLSPEPVGYPEPAPRVLPVYSPLWTRDPACAALKTPLVRDGHLFLTLIPPVYPGRADQKAGPLVAFPAYFLIEDEMAHPVNPESQEEEFFSEGLFFERFQIFFRDRKAGPLVAFPAYFLIEDEMAHPVNPESQEEEFFSEGLFFERFQIFF